jgi:hypothetical protein
VEKSGKLGQLPVAPVHFDLVAFKVWQQFVQKPLRKTPYNLCKVVEGPEIYNFGIYTSEHFSCKLWSNPLTHRAK